MNRTKYEKVIQSYGEKIKENITVVSFDLNNLKKINDNEGHEAGDIYIKTFADSLKKIFEDNKYLGRIGGDEFVVILDERINEIEKHIKALNVLFEMKMKNMECKFEASFAYGLANTKNDNNNNIKELIELADGRMYNNKQEQKKQKNASNLNNNKLKKTNKKV
jgi:diguanylate cyclase (GGDEF)-like protein